MGSKTLPVPSLVTVLDQPWRPHLVGRCVLLIGEDLLLGLGEMGRVGYISWATGDDAMYVDYLTFVRLLTDVEVAQLQVLQFTGWGWGESRKRFCASIGIYERIT